MANTIKTIVIAKTKTRAEISLNDNMIEQSQIMLDAKRKLGDDLGW